MSNNIVGQNRFEEKILNGQIASLAKEMQGTFNDLANEYPDYPLWPIAVSLMETLREGKYAKYLADIVPSVSSGEDSKAVIFGIYAKEGEDASTFLSIQATERGAIPLSGAVPGGILEGMIDAMFDINSDDVTPASALIRQAIEAITTSDHRVTAIDGDPEENLWAVQCYTTDGKYLMDVMVDYLVIQAYLAK